MDNVAEILKDIDEETTHALQAERRGEHGAAIRLLVLVLTLQNEVLKDLCRKNNLQEVEDEKGAD